MAASLAAGEHELPHAGPVVALDARHVVGQGRRVHRDLPMAVRAQPLRALGADSAVARRSAFGRAGDDPDVARSGSRHAPDHTRSATASRATQSTLASSWLSPAPPCWSAGPGAVVALVFFVAGFAW